MITINIMQFAYFFKIHVDNQQWYHFHTVNYLGLRVPKCNVNCSNEEVLNSLIFFRVKKNK